MSFRKVLGTVGGAALGVALLVSFGASAITITNRNKTDYTLIVTAGDKDETVVLAAGASLEHPCKGGCNISLRDGDETDATEKDRFVIEGGAIEIARD
jgi:hypothetical protein